MKKLFHFHFFQRIFKTRREGGREGGSSEPSGNRHCSWHIISLNGTFG